MFAPQTLVCPSPFKIFLAHHDICFLVTALTINFKGLVQRFSHQVIMNKCFLLNPEKNSSQIRAVVFKEYVKTA